MAKLCYGEGSLATLRAARKAARRTENPTPGAMLNVNAQCDTATLVLHLVQTPYFVLPFPLPVASVLQVFHNN